MIDTGAPTLGQALQQLPSVGGSYSSISSGTAIETVNFRAIGADRVLVLLNGKRWITDPNGLGDVGAIPVSIVDHVDVLKAGASAVYGADALSAVINIVTVDHFDGVKATVRYGMHFGDGNWDGKTQRYSLTLGSTSEKWSALFNVTYETLGPIFKSDRDFTSSSYGGVTGNYFGSVYTPQGRFQFFLPPSATLNPMSPNAAPNPAVTGLTSAQCPTQGQTYLGTDYYLPTCDLTLKVGQPGTSASDFRPWAGRQDRYLGNDVTSISSPHDNKSLYAQGRYSFTDNFRLHTTVFYNRELGEFWGKAPYVQIAPGALNADISASNPYNPFGIPLDASGGDTTNVQHIYRRLAEVGPAHTADLLISYYFDGGLDGDFTLGGRYFTWNADYVYTHLDQLVYHETGQRLYAALALQQLNGDLSQCQDQCAPLNLFGGQYHGGTITPAQYDWSRAGGAQQRPMINQQVVANLSTTDLFDLPAGPLGFAAGYGYQDHEGINYANRQFLMTYPAGRRDYRQAEYQKNSVYAEVRVPLLRNVPGFQELTVDYAVRYSDYSTFGDTTTQSVGLKWNPVEQVLLRGSYSEGFRVPQINDVVGDAVYHPNVQDPCSADNPNRPAACTSGIAGVPQVPANYVQQLTQIRTIFHGGDNLKPETSKSVTYGVVYSPKFAPGLAFIANAWALDVDNQITSINAGDKLTLCYRYETVKRCEGIHRAADGSLTTVEYSFINLGSVSTSGIDFGLTYRVPPTDFGDFSVKLRWSHVNSYEISGPFVNNASGGHSKEYAGYQFHPMNRATLGIDWALGNWSLAYQIFYTQGQTANCRGPANNGFGELCTDATKPYSAYDPGGLPIASYEMPDTYYNNARLTYHMDSIGTSFTLGVNNLFNEEPPILAAASFYQIPGRYAYIAIKAGF